MSCAVLVWEMMSKVVYHQQPAFHLWAVQIEINLVCQS